MQLREWNARLHGLVVFRALLGDPVVAKLAALTDRLEAADGSIAPLCDAVAAFEAALFAHTTNLGDYLSNAVLETETFCVRQAAAGQLSPVMEAALNSELSFLQKLCGLTLDTLLEAADRQSRELAFLPRWEARQLDLTAAYNQRMREAGKKGYGMFAKHHVFTVENGQLVPVKYPDPQKLSELPGYEKEREKVIANTRALLAGSPANNVLLFGDSGTGKSTSIKAIVNEFYPDGLRMIEIYKHQFKYLSEIIAEIKNRNYRFIIYMDDLSFEEFEIEYKFLKAVIEGGVETKPENILIYATSNRRHLIKESWNDRNDQDNSNDRHHSDTVEEKLSLVNRFGVTINYSKPTQKEYFDIVLHLARRAGVTLSDEELRAEANKWELSHGGISGRTAEQFVSYLASQPDAFK